MCWEREGAFTGEISPLMLRDAYVTHVILGHSERRLIFHETDEDVSKKVVAALGAGLVPIVCVGETLEERDSGMQEEVVERQLLAAMGNFADGLSERLIVASEPVWAIGTGHTATPALAQKMHAHIRKILEERFKKMGEKVPILYGGSMKPENAEALLKEKDINGGLIGGAALNAMDFSKIIAAAQKVYEG
jgi:triosephosphate isomerase